MFETDRLTARHFEKADLDDFAALCADVEVMRFVGDGTTLERAEVAHWIDVCQEKRNVDMARQPFSNDPPSVFTGRLGHWRNARTLRI